MAEEKLGIEFLAKVLGFNKCTDAARKVNRLRKTSDKATGALGRFNQAALNIGKVGEGMKNWGGKMMMQTGLVYQAAQDLSRKFNTVVGAFTAVETKGKELGMVLVPMGGDIKKSIDYATKSALNFSTKFGVAATDIMEAQYLLASAKITDPLITTKAAEWTIKLAKATREDVASAANIWANAANTFFDAATLTEDQMRKLSDTLAKTQQKFQFENLYQLGEGLAYAGSVSRQLKIPLETTATLLGTLNTAGIQGSMAGTGLQQTFLKLTKASKKLNINFKYTEDGSLDIINVFGQLKAKMVGMNSEAKTLFLQQLFGDRAFKAVATIIDKLDQVEEDLIDVSSATGVATKSFESMQKTTAMAFAKIRTNAFKLFYMIGKKIGPSLIKLSEFTVKVIEKITEFADKYPILTKIVGAFLGVGAAITGIILPLMTFIGIFAWGAGSIISLVGTIAGGLAALWPVLAAIGIALAVIAQLAATIFVGWKIAKWLSKLEIGGKTLREWIRHLLKITIFSERFKEIISRIVKEVKKIAPPVAFAVALALATPALINIAIILGYIASLVAVAFSAYKIGKWLGELELGSKTLGEWIRKFLRVMIFVERIKLAILKVVGKVVLTNVASNLKMIIITLTEIAKHVVAAFFAWKTAIAGTIAMLQTGLSNLSEWSRRLSGITLFANKIKGIFNEILEIVLKITAPLRKLVQLKIIKPIQEEIKKTKITEIIESGGQYGPAFAGPVMGPELSLTDKIKANVEKAMGGFGAPTLAAAGAGAPRDITATRPEINNYYYTTHFEKDSIQINTAELSPEEFMTILEEVIRRKSLTNEPT